MEGYCLKQVSPVLYPLAARLRSSCLESDYAGQPLCLGQKNVLFFFRQVQALLISCRTCHIRATRFRESGRAVIFVRMDFCTEISSLCSIKTFWLKNIPRWFLSHNIVISHGCCPVDQAWKSQSGMDDLDRSQLKGDHSPGTQNVKQSAKHNDWQFCVAIRVTSIRPTTHYTPTVWI